jgi:hypothetical protein
MPCGGIYPIAHHVVGNSMHDPTNPNHGCRVCQGPVDASVDLFVNEFTTFLHRACFRKFINSPEGEVILEHGHAILLPELGEPIRPPVPPPPFNPSGL